MLPTVSGTLSPIHTSVDAERKLYDGSSSLLFGVLHKHLKQKEICVIFRGDIQLINLFHLWACLINIQCIDNVLENYFYLNII